MHTSDAGLAFITRWEGLELHVYNDVAGYPTIGVGHLIVDSDPPEWKHRGITEEEALKLLSGDLVDAESAVEAYITWPLIQHQFDALVSFAFNVGGGALRASTLRKKLNAGEEGSVGSELVRWNKAGGEVVAGLTRRRQAESRLFNLGDYGL
jgi:lysozyme